MTLPSLRLSLECAPDVIHDALSGDVIVIHLTSGAYYALTTEGSAAWLELVGRDAALDESDARLALLAAFASEGLVTGDLPLGVEPNFPRAFTKYLDLEDVLLADPIHDVDESGWPSVRDSGRS